MTQSTVSTRRSVAFPGMLVDNRFKNSESKVSGEASAEIPFGVMVAQSGTDAEKVILLTALTDKLAGVVQHNHAYANDEELGTTGLKPKVSLSCLTDGGVWVIVEEDVTPDDPVHVRAVAAGAEVAGAFRISADGTDTIKLGFARWLGPSQTYGSIKVAPLALNLNARGATAA